MPATAANLPAEIFDPIASFYRFDRSDGCYDRHNEPVGINKHNLGAIALVCRRWALACQPKLFENIQLRNLEDFNRLWELMNHPSSRIAGYLKTIDCALLEGEDSGSIPWLHVACRKLKHHPKLSAAVQFQLSVFEKQAKELTMVIRSPMSRCHRITCIDTLYLEDVEFAWLEDLRRMVGELPCLTKAAFHQVGWDEPKEGGELPPMPSCRKSSQKSPTCVYEMRMCADDRAALWLACLHPPRKTPQVRIKDLQALYQTLSLFGYGLAVERESDVIYVNRGQACDSVEVTLRSPDTSQQCIHSLRFIEPDLKDSDYWRYPKVDDIMPQADLHEVCFHFMNSERMQKFATEVVAVDIFRVWFSSKLKFTLETTEGVEKRTVCQTDAVRQEIESWLEKKAEEYKWASEEAAVLSCAFRERDLEVYEPMIRKLRKAIDPEKYREPDNKQDQGSDKDEKDNNTIERGDQEEELHEKDESHREEDTADNEDTEDDEDTRDGDETEDSGEQKEWNLQTHKRTHDSLDQNTMPFHSQRPQKRPCYPVPVCVPEPYHEEEHISHGHHWTSSSQSRATDAHASQAAAVPTSHHRSFKMEPLDSGDLSLYAGQVQSWQQFGARLEHNSWCGTLETSTSGRYDGGEGAQEVQMTRDPNWKDHHEPPNLLPPLPLARGTYDAAAPWSKLPIKRSIASPTQPPGLLLPSLSLQDRTWNASGAMEINDFWRLYSTGPRGISGLEPMMQSENGGYWAEPPGPVCPLALPAGALDPPYSSSSALFNPDAYFSEASPSSVARSPAYIYPSPPCSSHHLKQDFWDDIPETDSMTATQPLGSGHGMSNEGDGLLDFS
ncbi:hypothetical protein NM688_g2711 [Phlebia brevispora]|uniref:Uncharacterized protein n=1 Tax=Phlebia brevispora TaxID=194682 RepID=A0ACC1T7L5_9APHY|nr:hypothetical protein NM688_g2711 [Phlebia brevispora]